MHVQINVLKLNTFETYGDNVLYMSTTVMYYVIMHH